MSGVCALGHTQKAYECPACCEAATGQQAPPEHWRWYRGRTSSKRIKALVDEAIKARGPGADA